MTSPEASPDVPDDGDPSGVGEASEPETGQEEYHEIVEHNDPGAGIVLRSVAPPPHPDRVRMYLAMAMLAILGGIVVTGCVGWLRGATLREMQSLATVLSPVITLVGTTLGFYFWSEGSGGRRH